MKQAFADYVAMNSLQWDKWVSEHCIWTIPISHEKFVSAKSGEYSIYVTPQKPIPKDWLCDVKGHRVLALASAGGQQCPILSAIGADVTVFDNSQKQLDTEKEIAEREGYSINIVKGDMTKPLPFDSESFDLIINPVSNSYIENLHLFWSECFRLLKRKGCLITGFANPDVYMFDLLSTSELRVKNKLPFNPLCTLSKDDFAIITQKDGVQFSHTLEEQMGGQIKSGFVITGFYEDKHPTKNSKGYDTYIGAIASKLTTFTAIYYATKSIKP